MRRCMDGVHRGFDDYTPSGGVLSTFCLRLHFIVWLAQLGVGIVWYTFWRVVIDIIHAWILSLHISTTRSEPE